MLVGIVPAFLLKDSIHSPMDETLPELSRLEELVQEESDLDSCEGDIDRALVLRTS